MHPVFIARGPAFKEGLTHYDVVKSVDMFALVGNLTGFPSHGRNGSLSRVLPLLKTHGDQTFFMVRLTHFPSSLFRVELFRIEKSNFIINLGTKICCKTRSFFLPGALRPSRSAFVNTCHWSSSGTSLRFVPAFMAL